MEIAVPIIMVIIVLVVILIRRKEHLEEVHSYLKVKQVERQEWNEKKFMSAGAVRDVHTALANDINAKFRDAAEKDLLMKIIDEWADLKIQSFTDKRSWVRNPD